MFEDVMSINDKAICQEHGDVTNYDYHVTELVFDQLPVYHIKILLGDFNITVGRLDIFKANTGSEC